MNSAESSLRDRLHPLTEKVESFCRDRPWTTMALSFGVGIGVGASPFAGIIPLAALKGLRKLVTDPAASLAGKLSLATFAVDVLLNASSMVGRRAGLHFDPLSEESLP